MRAFAIALLVGAATAMDMDAMLEAAEDEALAKLNWAASMTQIRLWEDGVEDERMVMVAQDATEAELMDPVSHQGIMTLQSWALVVLENQIVVAYNDPLHKQRNEYASRLACTDIYGVAIFMLVARKPVRNRYDLFEMTFFTPDLWDNYVTYMGMAREQADFFGGAAPWTMRIHWNTLPKEWREPWVMRKATLDVVARPRLIANADVLKDEM